MQRAGLFPLRLAQGVERALLDELPYRLYGMYLVVLAARMAAGRRDPPGHRDSPFLDQPGPRPPGPFLWDDRVRPLPGDAIRNEPLLRPGAPPDSRWPQEFVEVLSCGLRHWPRGRGRRYCRGPSWP